MSEWQDIETAPKDGTPIDIWWEPSYSKKSRKPHRLADVRCNTDQWQYYDAAWDRWEELDIEETKYWTSIPTAPEQLGGAS